MSEPPRSPRTRSPKVGRPPTPLALSPRDRRRRKTATAELRKGGTLFQTGQGPRALTAAKGPKRVKQKKG